MDLPIPCPRCGGVPTDPPCERCGGDGFIDVSEASDQEVAAAKAAADVGEGDSYYDGLADELNRRGLPR